MFAERSLPPEVEGVREQYAPDALVLDCERDFETLPSRALDDLAGRTRDITAHTYEESWLPADAPELLRRLTTSDLTVGMPGDGSVAWTTQFDPPVVVVKPRVEGTPESFVSFLVAEALVEVGLDLPEHFLGFFGERYPAFDAATPTDPNATYQLAHACCDAYRGLHTREEFAGWADDSPDLHDAWEDAGERLQPRIADLPSEIAAGGTDVADAAELACSGVKHGLDLPAPFEALDSVAFEQYGADYAVKWAQKVFEAEPNGAGNGTDEGTGDGTGEADGSAGE